MNISHLKYATEVARTGSFTKAAENLYISQPSLSRSIRELEDSIGITIFKRTPKGIVPTPEGEEFLSRALNITEQIQHLEDAYMSVHSDHLTFSISVPRASYIGQAMTEFVASIDSDKELEINYKETNSLRTIRNVMQDNFNLGIIRYHILHESYFLRLFKEKQLKYTPIMEFTYRVLLCRNHPLAQQQCVSIKDLKPYIQIIHGDPYVPSLPVVKTRDDEFSRISNRRISIYDRATQFQFLQDVPDTFMLCAPVPPEFLGDMLVQLPLSDEQRIAKDGLIHTSHYRLTDLDRQFLTILKEKAAMLM